jgi:hypothetical protein
MSEELTIYQTRENSFEGMSSEINESDCPASWKDVFVLNDDCGRVHLVPCVNVVLSEVGSGEWVFRTTGGDFKPVSNDPILEMIMGGVREFAVIATSYSVEIQKR